MFLYAWVVCSSKTPEGKRDMVAVGVAFDKTKRASTSTPAEVTTPTAVPELSILTEVTIYQGKESITKEVIFYKCSELI